MLYNASKGQKPSECSYSGHYMVPWTQTCPQPKQHRNPLIHFRRTHATSLSFFLLCGEMLPSSTPCHMFPLPYNGPQNAHPPRKKITSCQRGSQSPHNTWLHGFHPNMHPKWHLDRFRRFCTARVSSYDEWLMLSVVLTSWQASN